MTLTIAGRLVGSIRSSTVKSCRHARRKRYCTTTTQTPNPITTSLGPIKVQGVEIAKAYNPVLFESNTREKWKLRNKDKRKATDHLPEETEAPIFRMILPPPNVTGKLHLGHALTVAIQDAIARLKFMTGSRVEWIPGFDHAGIATQSMVNRRLQRNSNLNPEKLESELHKYSDSNREVITKQLEALGALLDWDKSYFTLDADHSSVVQEAFIHLFDNETIVRGNGIVNWSCTLQTSISDIEVEQIPFNGKIGVRIPGFEDVVDFGLLYFCEYVVPNSKKNITVATSRPETMFGDTAIAVNPEDPNYKDLIGLTAKSSLTGKDLKIIADSRVKMDFGTGAVKITPGHDKCDFAIGSDHNLNVIKTFTPNGNLNENCSEFTGMHRFKARSRIIEKLKELGSLVATKEYAGSIGLCSRSQDVNEHYVIPHWFLKTKHLTSTLLDKIGKGEFTVRPDNQFNNLVQMLNSPQDWCLSRQIKWGHPIPAYYHKDYPQTWVAAPSIQGAQKLLEEKLKISITNSALEIVQDQDVLDTWFSSALIPLSVSGWLDSDEFKQLSLMETGFDIVLFWVWRMAIITLGLTNKLPFGNVLLHGIVTDSYGRKMSKSKGNVIDPMDAVNGKSYENMISDTKDAFQSGELDLNEHDLRVASIKAELPNGVDGVGADGLRFGLLCHDISLQQIKLNMTHVENCKHFCNKLWQAMRFYFHHAENSTNHPVEIPKPQKGLVKSFGDQWILAALYEFARDYEESINACRFHLTTETIRHFLYSQYCDIYIELVKKDLRANLRNEHHILVMRYVFCTAMKLAHPFLPFVTEEIWHQMTEGQKGLLLDASLPTSAELEEFRNDEALNAMKKGIALAKEIRSLRSKYLSGSKGEREFFIELPDGETDIVGMADSIETLARVKLRFDAYSNVNKSDMVGTSFLIDGVGPCRISILKNDIVRLPNEVDEIKLSKMQEKLNKLKRQFDNPNFQQFAPVEAKERLKRRLDSLQMKIDAANTSNSQSSEH